MSVSAPNYIYPPVDSNPNTLYQGFVTYMQAQIPGWEPYSGELDDWLARAFAGIQASLTELSSDVETQIYRYFGAYIMNVPPNDATSATGTVRITVQDVNGPYLIPAYTQMSFPDASGTLQPFETLASATVPNGSTYIDGVPVAAMTPGSAGNSCSGSGDLDETGITFITGLSLDTPTANGTDAETDADYLNRLTQVLTTLSPSPITNADFTVLAGTQAGVLRAFTNSTFNPATWTVTGNTHGTTTFDGLASTANIPVGAPISSGSFPAGTYVQAILSSSSIQLSQAATTTSTGVTATVTGQLNQTGYVTSWVMGSSGPLSSPAMGAIQTALQAMCLEGVNYSVQAPTNNTVNVTAAVVAWPGVDPTATQAAVVSALQTFLSNFGINQNPSTSAPTTFGWLNDNEVRLVVLQNVIMNVPGVHYVNVASLDINGVSADLILQGIVPYVTPGTMTITVTNG